MSARLIQVIEVTVLRGKGIEANPARMQEADPVRNVIQYYSPNGELLAERDPYLLEFPPKTERELEETQRMFRARCMGPA